MAQKKGWIYRMTMGRDDNPDFDVKRLPGTRFAVFKDIFRNRFSSLVKINLLMLLFLIPAIAIVVISTLMRTQIAAHVPYTSNFGFGFLPNPDAQLIGAAQDFYVNMMMYLFLVPALLIASIGFAGAFHTMKLLVWGEGLTVTQAFFKGIKSNLVNFLWTTLILALGIALVGFNISSITLYNRSDFLSILALISSILLLVIIIFMSCYIYSQSVTYKLKLWPLLKNSFLFSIGMIFHNIFFILICTGLPILLAILFPTFALIIIVLYVFIGLAFTVLVWTLLTQHVFDRFINDKVAGAVKNRGMHVMTPEEKAEARREAEEKRKKSANVRFANPKRKKVKSIEEDESYTPLTESFSRADLQKLAEEKRKIKERLEAEDAAEDEDMTDTPDGAEAGTDSVDDTE